jgi:hypothetical protein
VKDFLGVTVVIDDIVLVAMRRGSNTWMVRRHVVALDQNGYPILEDAVSHRRYTYKGSPAALAVVGAVDRW